MYVGKMSQSDEQCGIDKLLANASRLFVDDREGERWMNAG